jgi:formylglycine-generating enzyme required for sulfatase activity
MDKLSIVLRTSWVFTAILFSCTVFGAPGEIQVDLESSTDQVAWNPASPGVVDVSTSEPFYRVTLVPVDGGVLHTGPSVQATTADPGGLVEVIFESSPDLSTWSPDTPGVFDVSGSKQFFQVRTADIVSGEFVTVNGGTFEMSGRQTTVSGFEIKRTEVTQAEWSEVELWALSNGYDFSGSADGCDTDHPIQSVTWYDVVKWCNARSEKDGLTPAYYTEDTLSSVYRTGVVDVTNAQVNWAADGYRLPTEAEWEFAARGGNSSSGFTYSGSNIVGDVAYYGSNSTGAQCNYFSSLGTWPVGQKNGNELGIVDMSGNVFEWCWDWFEQPISPVSATDPHGPDGINTNRSVRGGSWLHIAEWCEPAFRDNNFDPAGFGSTIGFRIVKVLPVVP